jgi:branched-chain amino acid transport system substrate-binding protein
MAANPGIPVEVIAADHRNKPDVAVSILRGWFDRDDVDMVIDLANSAVALACNNVTAEKNKVCIVTAGGTSALTGPACTPTLVHWTYDSWNLAHSTSTAVTRQGGKTWFFIVPNYAYGKAITADAARFVELSGGQVLGSAVYPFPETTDFSSLLLQAQSSGATVIAFGAGGTDFINLVKQSREFGLNQSATLVGMTGFITDVLSMGPSVSEGLVMTENFYWDLNDQTRSWFTRIKPQLSVPSIPNSMQAGNYAGTLHFLKAVKELGVTQAKASGRETVSMMKQLPTEDDCFGQGSIREDGRKIHAAYLFQVKPAAEIREHGAVYRLLVTTPAAEAFRPMSEGGCKLVKA